jgi:hypothetical protein
MGKIIKKQKEVAMKPTFTQEQALVANDFEIGYGGARGGGKTWAGQVWLLYDIGHPLFRALVIRRNADDLKDWIDRAKRIYESSTLRAVSNGNPPEFRFPSGAVIRTGHLKDENAYTKYQGHEYHRMVIEELTQIPTEENYLKLASSCRSTISELKPQIFSTFNPDGPGFAWVKRRFNIQGTPREPIRTVDPVTGMSRIFVPSRLSDNPHLDNDANYKAFLDGLPDGLREAWKDGCWDEPNIKGAYYTLELNQASREKRVTRVPFDPMYKVHTVWDLGISDSTAILFVQKVSNKEIRVIDYYENEGFGVPHYIAYLQRMQMEKSYIYGNHYAPHDVNKREFSTGLSIIETARKLGIKFEQVPNIGIADGIQKVRIMFPKLHIHQYNCEQLLNALRSYRKHWDDKKLMFSDNPIHDWTSHAADALRYLSLVEDKMVNEREVLWKQPDWNRISDYEG